MTAATQTTRHRFGFTLLELMLALSIAAVLALTLYAALGAAVRGRRSAEAAVGLTRVAAVAASLIAEDLESVLPPGGLLAGNFFGTPQSAGQDASADSLDFYCIGEDEPPPTDPERRRQERGLAEGVRHVQLTLRTDLTPPCLVRRIERNLLTLVAREPEEEILCRNVRSFVVRYFDGNTWVDTWDSSSVENALPVAVQLTIELQPADAGRPSTVFTRLVPLVVTSAGGQP